MCNLFCIYLDIYNRDVDVWFCCMSLASVGLRPNVSSPNLHCTLIGSHTIARRRLRRCTPRPLFVPAPVTFLSLLPWHGSNLSFVTLPTWLVVKFEVSTLPVPFHRYRPPQIKKWVYVTLTMLPLGQFVVCWLSHTTGENVVITGWLVFEL